MALALPQLGTTTVVFCGGDEPPPKLELQALSASAVATADMTNQPDADARDFNIFIPQ